VTAYRLCLLGPTGTVTAVQRLHADTDKEALEVAKETVKAVPAGKGHAKVSGFELWEGARKVRAESAQAGEG